MVVISEKSSFVQQELLSEVMKALIKDDLESVRRLFDEGVLQNGEIFHSCLATALNVMGLEQGLDYANLNNIKALFILVNDNKVLSYPSKEFKTLLN